jgi:hypothetical protein
LPDPARQALLQIYNAVIELEYTPLLWRGSDIIFLRKPGKKDYADCRAFRPISLMPFLFKALERLVKWHMEDHADTFHPDQHAFRKGHCTENALSQMVDTAESAVLNGKIALAIFLDIKGAFDNLSSPTIAQGMKNHNVNENITNWMTKYLDSGYCRVKGSKQCFRLIKGIGQGGILSPTLWNFVRDSFLEQFLELPVEAIAYADDGALIIVSNDMLYANFFMQKALNAAKEWAVGAGLTFSIPKTNDLLQAQVPPQPPLPTYHGGSGGRGSRGFQIPGRHNGQLHRLDNPQRNKNHECQKASNDVMTRIGHHMGAVPGNHTMALHWSCKTCLNVRSSSLG